MTGVETEAEKHERIMRKVRREMYEAEQAELERLYAPKPRQEEALPYVPWVSLAYGIDVIEIPPPTPSTLKIHGTASTSSLNTHDQALAVDGMEVASMPVPLLVEHDDRGAEPIGDVYYIRRTTHSVYIKAALRDHFAARYVAGSIVTAQLSGLSAASARNGNRLLAGVGDKVFYDRWVLKEVSVCRSPANKECCCEILRE